MSIVNINSRRLLGKNTTRSTSSASTIRSFPPLRTLSPEFDKALSPDLIIEMTRNSHLYVVDSKSSQTDWITVRHLPISIVNVHGFLRHRVEKDRPPGLRTFLCLCLTFGIDIFKTNDCVSLMMSSYEKLFRNKHTGSPEEAFAIDFLRMPIQLSNTQKGSRHTIPVTEWIKNNLSDMKETLGVDLSYLVEMCIYSYLMTQEIHISSRQISQWSQLLEEYLTVLDVKAKGLDAMIRMIYK